MPAQPQTNTSDLLNRIIALDSAGRELSELEIRALRNQIEAVRKHRPDEGAMLSAALAFFLSDFDAGVTAVRTAFRLSSHPQLLRVCVQAVMRAGRIVDALEFSKEMIDRFPGSVELQRAEVKIAFGSGQLSRVAAGVERLEAMGVTDEVYDPVAGIAILHERGYTENDLTNAIAAARSFLAEKALRVRGYVVVATPATSGVDSHLHYSYNVGLDVDQSLEIEDSLINHMIDLELPIYADGTVVMSMTTVDLGEASSHDS